MLEVRDLGRKLESNWIWKGLEFSIGAGARMALHGPTGSGKSLLLRVLAGLDDPDQGELVYRNRALSRWKLTEYRMEVGLLPQRPAFAEGTVEQNWRMPLKFHSRYLHKYDSVRLKKWVSELGLPDDFHEKSSGELSGGERQLAALLRLLMFNPIIVLLDEPSAALDEITCRLTEQLLDQWQREQPERSWIWVCHDYRQVARIANRELNLGDLACPP